MKILSRKIRLVTAEHIPSQTDKQLGILLYKIFKLYAKEGFMVNVIVMDQ